MFLMCCGIIKSRLQVVLGTICLLILGLIVCSYRTVMETPSTSNFERLMKLHQVKQYDSGFQFSTRFDTFQKLEKYLNIEDQNKILNKFNCSNIPFLLVVVFSGPTNVNQRNAIRSTWSSNGGSLLVTRFLIGIHGLTFSSEVKLREEQSIHEDILFGEFVDSYHNLTLKAMTMLMWTNRTLETAELLKCSNPHFLMKADDDTFINIDEVVNIVANLKHKPVAVGSIISGAETMQRIHNAEANIYPDYLSGSVYILSVEAVQEIIKVSNDVKPLWLEDIYVTGILASTAGVTLINIDKFQAFSSQFNPCSKQISCHKVSPKRMLILYNVLLNSEKYCQFVQNNVNV